MPDDPILLLGDGDLAEEVRQALDALDASLLRLVKPTQREVAEAFEHGDIAKAVVVSRDDAVSLRTALMVRDVSEDVELLVTYFDPATAGQVAERLAPCQITSLADVVAPTLAGPCFGDDVGAVQHRDGKTVALRTSEGGDRVEERELTPPDRRRGRSLLWSLLKPFDKSAALLLYGALGILGILLLETVSASLVLDQKLVDSFYGASKTLVTVDPNDKVAGGPAWFKTVIAILMLVALVFEACFTAGIVNRLIDRRLTGMFGRSAVPRRDHVVVIGLGKVGLRLCLLLRDCGVAVVAVDHEEEGENVGLAKELGLPVVIGRGADPNLLHRLSVRRSLAVAAVTDDDLENLSSALSALSVHDEARVVMRVGDGRLANETRSLFKLGTVRDVHRIAASLIAAQATGSKATHVVCRDEEAHLVHEDGSIEEAAIAAAT